MKVDPLSISHAWDLLPKDAIALQKQLSTQVIRNSTLNIDDIVTVTGIDTHYLKEISLTAAVTIRLTDMETVEYSTAVKRLRFPYIPGLLTFREGPAKAPHKRTISLW